MPITPFHLGPTLAVLMIGYRYLDITTFFIAALVIDLEPVFLFLLGSSSTFYLSHTFLFGTLIGVIVAYAVHLFRVFFFDYWQYVYPNLNWRPGKEVPWRKMVLSGIAGVWSHIIWDRLASSGILSLGQIYLFSLVLFLAALITGFWLMIRREIAHEEEYREEGYNVVQ